MFLWFGRRPRIWMKVPLFMRTCWRNCREASVVKRPLLRWLWRTEHGFRIILLILFYKHHWMLCKLIRVVVSNKSFSTIFRDTRTRPSYSSWKVCLMFVWDCSSRFLMVALCLNFIFSMRMGTGCECHGATSRLAGKRRGLKRIMKDLQIFLATAKFGDISNLLVIQVLSMEV